MLRLVPLLLLALPTRAEPLQIFEKLIGDQWVSSSKLPNGEEVRSRTVWTWGVGKQLVRMRQYVLGKEGEVQRYETILAHDKPSKKIQYRVFSGAGLVARGTAYAKDGGVVLEQPRLESFPAMRTAYSIDKDGLCLARISFKGEQGWKQRMESRLRRTKIENYKQLKLEGGANPLAPLAPFVGVWENRFAADKPVHSTTTGEWSLHRRLLRVYNTERGKEQAERYVSFDPRTGAIIFFVKSPHGDFLEGTITKKNDSITWHCGTPPREGKSLEWRLVCTLAQKDLHKWAEFTRWPADNKLHAGPSWISTPRKSK
ncbi:MAG: hypothetical protein ACYTHK_10580 [Planctomycetota bacterium]|jgi:hypothetical protein